MFADILKFVADLGEKEMENGINEVKNYYVLVIYMAGVVDDFMDALNQMLRAAKLPVSIYVVKMGANPDNDSEKFASKALPAIRESERNFVDLLEFEHYKDDMEGHNKFYAS